MATTAETFRIARENLLELPVKGKITPRQQSDVAHEKDTMPPRRHADDNEVDEFALRESMHVLMLANTSMCKALEAQVTAAPKPNGHRATIIAALLISFIPQAFSVVWWTRGTERDTVSRVGTIEYKLEQAEKRSTIYERELRLQQQYNMNLQLWLRERGVKGIPTAPALSLEENR